MSNKIENIKLAHRMAWLQKSLEKKESGKEDKKFKPSFSREALKLPIAFSSAIIGGAAFGLFIDFQLGSSPWALCFFLFSGFMAGIFSILRASVHKEGVPFVKGFGIKRKGHE